MCVCVCVYVCVKKRGTERGERESEREKLFSTFLSELAFKSLQSRFLSLLTLIMCIELGLK